MALRRKAAHFKLRFAVSSVKTCTRFLSALPLTFPSLALAFSTTWLLSQSLGPGESELFSALKLSRAVAFPRTGSGVISLCRFGCWILKSQKRLQNSDFIIREPCVHSHRTPTTYDTWDCTCCCGGSDPASPTQQYSRKNQYPLWPPGNLLFVRMADTRSRMKLKY